MGKVEGNKSMGDNGDKERGRFVANEDEDKDKVCDVFYD